MFDGFMLMYLKPKRQQKRKSCHIFIVIFTNSGRMCLSFVLFFLTNLYAASKNLINVQKILYLFGNEWR